jgi:hypothetical protein
MQSSARILPMTCAIQFVKNGVINLSRKGLKRARALVAASLQYRHEFLLMTMAIQYFAYADSCNILMGGMRIKSFEHVQ